MKNIFFICFCALFAFSGCADDDDELITGGNIDRELLPNTPTDAELDKSLFEVINMDYPGLEKVKEFYETGEYYRAANALLEYYRTRININNPNISLFNSSISDFDLNIADQAINHQFYVRNFYQNKNSDGVETYYSFWDNDKKKIDWSKNQDKVTSQEFRYQLHRHQWMLPQAKAYRISNNDKYTQSWIEVYKDWLKTFPYERGTVYPPEGGSENDKDYQWKGLQVAERVLSQIDIMAYFIQSPSFTPEWLTTFLATFEKEIDCIRLNYYQKGNILITQAQAVATAGVLMPEFKDAEIWTMEGINKLKEEMNTQFLTDGVQYELDPSYHIAAIDDFLKIYSVLEANNKQHLLDANFFKKLKQPAHFVMDIIYPDYSIDNFNDTRSSSYTKSVLIKNLKKYTQLIAPEDNELLWMATEGKQGQKPTYLYKAYEQAGYYMLRTGWDESSTMMILKNNYNPNNEWHCQPDNGTFGLYHNKRNFFPDAGSYSYDSDNNRKNYRATKNHNTITVQSKTIGEEQGGVTEGRFLDYIEKDNYSCLITENASYTDITHRRAVFFVNKEFFVIVDEAYGNVNSSTKVNINFHMLSDTKNPTVYDETEDNSYIGAHTTFSDENNMLIRTFSETGPVKENPISKSTTKISNKLGDDKAGIRAGYQYSSNRPRPTDSASQTAARFISVIYPFGNITEADKDIKVEFTDNNDGVQGTFHPEGVNIKVTINNTPYNLSYTLN